MDRKKRQMTDYMVQRIYNLVAQSNERITAREDRFLQSVQEKTKVVDKLEEKIHNCKQLTHSELKLYEDSKKRADWPHVDAIWRRLVDSIIIKDPLWGQKCQNPQRGADMDQVQKVMWSDFCLRMQKEPRMVTIPKGTEFNHSTECKFPNRRKYPYSMFNFYTNDPNGFMQEDGVTYFYKTKCDIPNVIAFDDMEVDQSVVLERLDSWFQEWDPNYVTNAAAKTEAEMAGNFETSHEYDDYRPSAYVCQVLGWGGVIYDPNIIMLCGNGSKWLTFQRMRENATDVPECKEYSGVKLASGANSQKNQKMGQHYFEKEDALARREGVRTRSQFYRERPTPPIPYYDISVASREEED